MTGDRTLEDFLGDAGASPEDDDSGEGDPGGGDEAGGGDGNDEESADANDPEVEEAADANDPEIEEAADANADADADPATVDPAVATYRWSPDGAVCEACGETVERRWLDDEGYVCAACKEW